MYQFIHCQYWWKSRRYHKKIKIQLEQPKLTEADIENRNYTLVSVYRNSPQEGLIFEKFLVSSPCKEQARKLANLYIKKIGWTDCTEINLYPRNYVKSARYLWQEGKYL